MPEDRSDEETSDQESEEEEEESDAPELKKSRNKALLEFRFRVEQAILGNYLLSNKSKKNTPNENEILKDIKLWGVTLLPKEGHEGTNTVLMKFLKSKRYKVHEAFVLLRKTLKWRADFRPDELGEDLRPETDNLWFSNGRDKEGRPLCYNVLGKESHKKPFISGDQKYQKYLRWRVLCVERGIQNLNFRPGEADSIIQIIDLKNAPGQAMKEVKLICKKMINLLHDHYPGVVYKNLIINVPSWFLALNALNLRLITQRSKNKFIFVKPSRVTETLLEYATIENILVQYGGLKRENDAEFSTDDKVLEANIRASTTEYIQIPVNEAGVTVTWDVTVVGYEVTYKEEFIPDDDCSYKILLQEKKMKETTRNTFHIREPGKIVITIVNGSYTKKKAFYRYKSRPTVPMYMLMKS
ncbi:Phosphatidylinositol transfer protein SEC14 [Handroanthus impetiginosus]|uniref:Phosphatidylinositol transfer protein SEC14 n=1 Tax=Handroanthus impetiginosus TaxID=429701 RepID=A0A2G9H0I7_9LAMI|nr:Phosphatidylinositol transfer protein SEC14 [Handroanthus impetiginosus]